MVKEPTREAKRDDLDLIEGPGKIWNIGSCMQGFHGVHWLSMVFFREGMITSKYPKIIQARGEIQRLPKLLRHVIVDDLGTRCIHRRNDD